jgi:lysozyme
MGVATVRVAGLMRARSAALALVLALVAGAFSLATPAAAAGPLHGVDVSGWQGQVDWGAVQRSGRMFGFAKATEGATFVDRTFAANRAAMGQAGLVLRGFYHFARPDRNTAAEEAAHFLRTVGPLGPGEVAVLDLEVTPGLPGIGDWAAEWLGRVHQATGRVPMIYSYQSYLHEIPTSRLAGYPLWVAAWGDDNGLVPTTQPKTDRWNRWTFWQYTSQARVPGVSTQVDDNIFSGTVAELAALGGTPPPPPPDPLAQLVKNVLDGLGGLLAPK